MLTLILMALRYMNGRKLRTVLTTLAVVFGVAVLFGTNLVLPSAMVAFQRMTLAASGQVDLSIVSASGESFAPEQALKTVAGVDSVQGVTGVLRRQYSIPLASNISDMIGATPQITLVGIDPATAGNVRPYVVSQGRFLQPGDTNVAVVPAILAELAPQLKIGATFPLITTSGIRQVTIIGALGDRGNPTSPQIIIPLDDAQKVFNQPGLVNTLEIALKPGVNRDTASAEILKALGSGFRTGESGTGAAELFSALEVGYGIANLFGILALFVGVFLIFNTFRTVVVERRHDLAMLRAIGAERRQLTWLILIESLLQGVIGTAIGLTLGYVFAAGLSGIVGNVAKGIVQGLQMTVTLSPLALLGPILMGLLSTLIAGYLPARAAGSVSPLEALRPAAQADVRRAARWSLIAGAVIIAVASVLLVVSRQTAGGGALLFLIGLVVAAPGLVIPVSQAFSPLLGWLFGGEGILARGNLIRQPERSAITASTLMIGLAVFIVSTATVASLDSFISSVATRTFGSDMMLMPPTVGILGGDIGADENLANRLRAVPQVQTVGSLRYATSAINGQSVQVLSIDPENNPKVAPLDFSQGEPTRAYAELAAGRTAIANSLMAAKSKLKVGDNVTLQTSEGPQVYRIVGVANDLLTFKIATLIISHASMKADFHKAEDLMLMINLKPGANVGEARQAVETIAADYPQFSVKMTGEYRQMILDMTTGGLQMMYIIGLLIAIPATLGLLNTLTINVMERTREIGVIRAVGGDRAQVRRMIIAEALLLGLFGAAIGVVAGVAMSYGFISAFSTLGWSMPYFFPAVGIVAAVVIGVVLALSASILPARSAAHLDIVRALQYE